MSPNIEFTPGPCRSLMADGVWQIPEDARPADWQQRVEPKAVEPDFPKTPYLYLTMPARKEDRGPRAPKPQVAGRVWTGKVGRPKGSGRLGNLSAKDIVAREEAGRTIGQIAADLQCNQSHLYRILQRSPGLDRPQRKCVLCHNPTERAANAKYCSPCAPPTHNRKKGI